MLGKCRRMPIMQNACRIINFPARLMSQSRIPPFAVSPRTRYRKRNCTGIPPKISQTLRNYSSPRIFSYFPCYRSLSDMLRHAIISFPFTAVRQMLLSGEQEKHEGRYHSRSHNVSFLFIHLWEI